MGDSNDGGEDALPDSESASETALLEVYATLREEILRNGDNQARRNTRGVAAMIVLIGYAVNFERPAVVALVPVVFSYLLVRISESLIWASNASYQLSRIERELSKPGSAMRHEIERGGLAGDDLDESTKRLRNCPGVSRLILGSLAYVASLVTPILVWEQIEAPTVAGVVVTQNLLIAVYVGLLVLTVGAGLSLHLYMGKLKAAIRPGSEDESTTPKQSDTGVENDES